MCSNGPELTYYFLLCPNYAALSSSLFTSAARRLGRFCTRRLTFLPHDPGYIFVDFKYKTELFCTVQQFIIDTGWFKASF